MTSKAGKHRHYTTVVNMLWICLVFLLNGALVSSEEESCREGWYGSACGLQCSNTCRPLETFPCHKDTGKCSEGCKRGFYGPMCERNCSCTGPCIQDTGDCIGDQPQPRSGPTPQPCSHNAEAPKLWIILAIVFIVLFTLMTVVFVAYIIYLRRISRQDTLAVDGTEMHHVVQPLLGGRQNSKNSEQQLNDARKKIQHLEEKQEKLITEHNTSLQNLGLCQNSSYHLLKKSELSRSALLQCTWLKLDQYKVNVSAVNLDVYGKLSNKQDPSLKQQDEMPRFIHYSGTTTTHPLQVTGSAQYWEVKSNIAFTGPIPENEILLELGFCNEEDRDKGRFTPERKHCYSFRVVYCSTHKPICFKVFSDNKVVLDQETSHKISIESAKDSSISFDFGILLHPKLEKITIFDLENKKHISTISIDLKKEILPMFGLGAEVSTNTNMSLVCGSEISMNDEKIAMISNTKI